MVVDVPTPTPGQTTGPRTDGTDGATRPTDGTDATTDATDGVTGPTNATDTVSPTMVTAAPGSHFALT